MERNGGFSSRRLIEKTEDQENYLMNPSMSIAPNEVALGGSGQLAFPQDMRLLQRPDFFIGDTGATKHSSISRVGGINVRESNASTLGITGESCSAQDEFDLPVTVCDKWGNMLFDIKMESIAHMPESNFNLLSLTRLLQDGWEMSGDAEAIVMTKEGIKLSFDIVIPTGRGGALYCICLKRNVDAMNASVTAKMPYEKAHSLLGHCNEDTTRKIAKLLGWELKPKTTQCQSCAEGKAKQKNLPQVADGVKATKPMERVYHDLSHLKAPKGSGVSISKPNWQMIVDERTGLKISAWYSTKNEIVEPTCERLRRLEQVTGNELHFMRQDNAGENKLLQMRMRGADWQFKTEFEYTARDTPQQNSLVEVGFSTIASRGRAMMNQANIPRVLRYALFPSVTIMATKLDWLTVIDLEGVAKTRIEHFQGKLPAFAKHLRTWGEAGTVKMGKDGKVGDRGATMMFIGYANDHTGNVYQMYYPVTKRIWVTRDVIWLQRMYFTVPNSGEIMAEPIVILPLMQSNDDAGGDDDDEDDIGEVTTPIEEAEDSSSEAREGGDDDESQTSNTSAQEWQEVVNYTKSGRVTKRPTSFEPETGQWVSAAQLNMFALLAEIDEDEMEVAAVGAGIGGGFGNTTELKPMKFKEAINGPDGEAWRLEIENEHKRMLEMNVFEVTDRSALPPGVKPIDSTWACKKKSNGTLRGRLNARGFKQRKGVHYDASSIHAPVTNATTIRVILTIMIMAGWAASVVDVKGAFLHGEFEDGEEIYMEVPEGWENKYPKGAVLKLLKTIYGLKQAAMAFWRMLLKCMKSMDMKRSVADPCLYFKWTSDGLVVILSWIDDNLIVGCKEAVEKTKAELMSRFDCEDCGELDEYIGNRITAVDGGKALKFVQPVLIQKMSDEFDLPDGQVSTPAKPGNVLLKCDEGSMMNGRMMTYFRSGVGMLIHLMQWSRPEISHATRDCARHMQSAGVVHVDAMHRIMQYCRDTPNRGTTLRPNAVWDGSRDFLFVIGGRSDSDYAKDPETRKSVSGIRVSLNEAPCIWRSSTQKNVTISVTEAEANAAVLAAQDMLYIKNVVESLGLQVQQPMVLEVDNQGAVDLLNNWSVGGRTRHIDVRINFMRELKEEGILVVRHVPGDENDSDMHTKNLGNPLFEKFCEVYFGADEYSLSTTPEREGVRRA